METAARTKAIIESAAAAGATAVFACVNLHNFKALNVLVGPEKGDRILERVQTHLSGVSIECWRTGGDNFVALFEEGLETAVGRMRSFSWLYQVTVGATEAWRFEYGGAASRFVQPWRTMQAIMTPRCGLVGVGVRPDESLGQARQRCTDHATAAYEAGWTELTSGPWAGFAPLARGFWNERRIAEPACPKCESSKFDVVDQDLGWSREKCRTCKLEYDRNDVLIVQGEQTAGGYM